MNIQKISSQKLARNGRSVQQGVVLLEALVAILIFSMGVLALVGLQAAMIKNTSDAKYRAEASFIAQQWIGIMWSNPDSAVAYLIPDNSDPRYDISARLPSGTRTVTQPDPALNQYVVTVTWQQPGQPQHNFTTIASIAGG
ncbi:MAG: type IV pilus modification protein PilV [Gallionella sp.]